MSAKTTSSECDPLLEPDGYFFLAKGPIEPKNNTDLQKPIKLNFDNYRPKRPLPPIVQANFESKPVNGRGEVNITIFVNAIVFINVEASQCIIKNGTKVYWNENYATPEFFISYNSPEKVSRTFYAYEFNFKISRNVLDGNTQIPEITTYLVNEDPITSRGTKTTVQPPVM